MKYPLITLKEGRDRTARAGHPWIFSGAIEPAKSELGAAGVVDVQDAAGVFLCRGLFSPSSMMAVRALTARQDEMVNGEFYERRIKTALALREQLFPVKHTNAYRLINSEGDFLPGLVVDRYADILVVQISTAGMESQREKIVAALTRVVAPAGIYERSDMGARREEKLGDQVGVLFGEVPDQVEILENGARFMVDVKNGQKTGFYLDQKENRRRLAELTKGKRVLNCFSYTGGFSVAAALAGAAQVTSVDSSRPALELAEGNFKMNGLDPEQHEFIVADMFEFLEDMKNGQKKWDVIVLDPPAFVKSRQDITGGLKAYTQINELAMRCLTPGGILATFSCSHHVGLDAFSNMVHIAASRANRAMQILETRFAAADHPVSVHFPEGHYLKGYIMKAGE
ncbi:class I SAM-dependent rRNA methyltransferase [Candidatus Uhrbacteria bacterium]|nr:class I SAM-dependent rRNA methyltransferase [Candidatus Uhrbacteria bacterium]